MRITGVERFLVDVPFYEVPDRNTARDISGWHISEVCRITTDSDLVGYGETLPNYTWGRVTDAAVARVQGKAPAECMWDDRLGAGLQMALFDLAGKAAGVPVYRLLGQKLRESALLNHDGKRRRGNNVGVTGRARSIYVIIQRVRGEDRTCKLAHLLTPHKVGIGRCKDTTLDFWIHAHPAILTTSGPRPRSSAN